MTNKWFYTPYLDDPTVKGHEQIVVYKNSLILEYPCPDSTECCPYVLKLEPGRYQFEVWGAQGGGSNTGIQGFGSGGKGGYSRGKFILEKTTTFYIYIGSSGLNGGNGGYNGGGAVGSSMWVNNEKENRAPGGGATDIRLVKGSLQSLKSVEFYTTYYGPNESLQSRIIVAGGGGGTNIDNGYGGGLHGSKTNYESATSGDQSQPGKTYLGIDAGFGYGGYTNIQGQGISGGGGGWYGGGGSTNAMGGSGYVNKTFFYHSETIAGNEQFQDPFGKIDIGHSGNGVAKITYLNIFYDCTKSYLQHRLLFLSCFLFIIK